MAAEEGALHLKLFVLFPRATTEMTKDFNVPACGSQGSARRRPSGPLGPEAGSSTSKLERRHRLGRHWHSMIMIQLAGGMTDGVGAG